MYLHAWPSANAGLRALNRHRFIGAESEGAVTAIEMMQELGNFHATAIVTSAPHASEAREFAMARGIVEESVPKGWRDHKKFFISRHHKSVNSWRSLSTVRITGL